MFEKEAEKWVENNFHNTEEDYIKAFKDGAEFGYNKANEWHDLRKNPEDLPPHEESVKDLSVDVTVVARSARVTAFYDFKNRIWLDCHFWRLIPGVTAWCEIPEFVEEE